MQSPSNGAVSYTSLSYQMQVDMSYEQMQLGVLDIKGTTDFTVSITLRPNASYPEIHGTPVNGRGTSTATIVSGGDTCNGVTGTGVYDSAVGAQSSFENGTVSFYNFGVGNWNYTQDQNDCIANANSNIVYDLIDSCFETAPADTNGACSSFPIQGGTNAVTMGPTATQGESPFKSISGTARLALVNSTTTTGSSSTEENSTSSSTSLSTTETSSSTNETTNCGLSGFGVQLFGVRTASSATNYSTRVSDGDTFFIDGKFFQPALPRGFAIDVKVTVTVTGADDVPVNYGAPVTGSLGAQPTPDVPTTWVTLAPPPPPLHRPLGLWQAVASAQITLSGPTCSAEIGPILSNVVPFVVQSKTPTVELQTRFPNGTVIPIPVYGNVTSVTPASVVDTNGLYALKFNATGQPNSAGTLTLVVAKNLVPTRWTPAVMVNGMRIPVSYQTPQLVKQCFPICYVAGFSQDSSNYYVRITMHFSTDSVVVDMVPPQFSDGQSASLVLGQGGFDAAVPSRGAAGLRLPGGSAFDASGDLWVVDRGNNRVLEFKPPFSDHMSASLVIGQPGFATNGSSTSQTGLKVPYSIAFDKQGDLWVADSFNNRVLEFTPPFTDGMGASLVIGQSSFTNDSESTSQSGLWFPAGIAFDSSGNLWVADLVNSRVLRFTPPFSNGMAASLVIGEPDYVTASFVTSHNGLYGPLGLAFDSSGDLWVADSYNNRTLEFTPPFSNGMNASLAIGQSSFTSSSDSCLPSQSTTCLPDGVAFDQWGNLWVTDSLNNRILEFTPPFAAGMAAATVLGEPDFNSTKGGTSVNTLLLARAGVFAVTNVAFDPSGNLWVGDGMNNRMLEYVHSSGASAVPEFPNAALIVTVTGLMVGVAFASRRWHSKQRPA